MSADGWLEGLADEREGVGDGQGKGSLGGAVRDAVGLSCALNARISTISSFMLLFVLSGSG